MLATLIPVTGMNNRYRFSINDTLQHCSAIRKQRSNLNGLTENQWQPVYLLLLYRSVITSSNSSGGSKFYKRESTNPAQQISNRYPGFLRNFEKNSSGFLQYFDEWHKCYPYILFLSIWCIILVSRAF